MASVTAEISTVSHKSSTETWTSASTYSPKKLPRKEGGPSRAAQGQWTLLFRPCGFLKDRGNSLLVLYGMAFLTYILKFHSKDLFSKQNKTKKVPKTCL